MTDQIDIEKIIGLVRQQEPNRQDEIKTLQKCIGGQWINKGYYRFVDSTNANHVGAEWQIDENVALEQDNEEEVVLDFLKNGQIGGIEFIGLLD